MYGRWTRTVYYAHQEWGPELNSQMHETIAADPNILG